MKKLIPVEVRKLNLSPHFTALILGNDQKEFAIAMQPHVGEQIEPYLREETLPRPPTHALLDNIFSALDITILQVVITEVQDTVYKARLFLKQEREGKIEIVEVDARPSDVLPLALLYEAAIFCTEEVFDLAVAF